jgi:hypothetical protein
MYKSKNNKLIIGILSSIGVTIFAILLLYVIKYMPNNLSLEDYFQDLVQGSTRTSATLSVCLLANIPLMYYHQRRRNFNTFYGISIIIGLMAIIIIGKRFNLF